MVFDRRFAVGLTVRLVLALAALGAFASSLLTPGLGAARILAFAVALGAGIALWRYIQRTNMEVARFIDAVRFGDLQARFQRPEAGSGFDALGEALDSGIAALREERARLSESSRFYEAVVDDVPVALLTIDAEGRIDLVNKAARKLFDRHKGVRAQDFEIYGARFSASISTLAAGRNEVVILSLETGNQRAMVRAAALARFGGTMRVVAVQPIQAALNAVEIAAQSDLVRVLTHEIMNSMTPVTSLARTAAEIMAEVDNGTDPAIADAHAAVETLARRADGVMHFVETYREITRPPRIERRRFAAAPFAEELRRLFAADWPADRATLALDIAPVDMLVDADPDMLAQVLINLLRNAADAVPEGTKPEIALRFAGRRSGRTMIEVEDNGPGVPEGLRHDIFLPFFTTKKKGTGVGLSLARQVLLAHDGTIEIETGARGGALFRMTL